MVDQSFVPQPVSASPAPLAFPEPETQRQARRVVPLELPAPYDHYHVEAWVNYPRKLLKQMRSGEEEQVAAALRQIIVSHDLTDFEGQPLPAISDPAFFDDISDELLVVVLRAAQEQIGKLTPTSGRS